MPPATATTTIEIDTSLLERLRARHPGNADRAMIEDIARIDLGFSALRQAKQRNALTEGEATELGVSALRDARRAPA
jgi:hypothetical protein